MHTTMSPTRLGSYRNNAKSSVRPRRSSCLLILCQSCNWTLVRATEPRIANASELVPEVDFSFTPRHLDWNLRARSVFSEEGIEWLQQPALPPRGHHIRQRSLGPHLARKIDDPALETICPAQLHIAARQRVFEAWEGELAVAHGELTNHARMHVGRARFQVVRLAARAQAHDVDLVFNLGIREMNLP